MIKMGGSIILYLNVNAEMKAFDRCQMNLQRYKPMFLEHFLLLEYFCCVSHFVNAFSVSQALFWYWCKTKSGEKNTRKLFSSLNLGFTST